MPAPALAAISPLQMMLFGKYQQTGLLVYVVKIIGRLHRLYDTVCCVIGKMLSQWQYIVTGELSYSTRCNGCGLYCS